MSTRQSTPESLRIRPEPRLEFNSADAIDQRVRRQATENIIVDALVSREPSLAETFSRHQLAALVDVFVERLRLDGQLKRKERSDVVT